MTVKDLIKQLEKMPQDVNVNIFDWRKNLANDWGNGSSEGIYTEFEINYENLTEDELEYYEQSNDRKFVPWVSITFHSDDYSDDGKCLLIEEE